MQHPRPISQKQIILCERHIFCNTTFFMHSLIRSLVRSRLERVIWLTLYDSMVQAFRCSADEDCLTRNLQAAPPKVSSFVPRERKVRHTQSSDERRNCPCDSWQPGSCSSSCYDLAFASSAHDLLAVCPAFEWPVRLHPWCQDWQTLCSSHQI